jgi:putative transposase
MELLRGFVYKLYPTEEQARLLAQTVGVVRLVYNLALAQRAAFGGKRPDGTWRNFHSKGSSADLSALRREYPWIGAVSQTAQNQALVDLDKAYKNFFAKRADYPTPRRRGVNDAFRHVGREIEVRRLNSRWSEVKVPKIGWIRYRDTRPLAANAKGVVEIRNATLRRKSDGGWEISIALKCEIAARPTPVASVGIDRGVTVPFALSTGEMVLLPETMKRREASIRRAQKDLSRRKKGSKRYARAKARVARLKARNANARRHLAHTLSRQIVRQFGLVALEELKTRNMTASARGTAEEPGRNVAQKAGLNRAILNVGWYQFQTMLAYKLEETGGLLVTVPAAYTSQGCSACDHVAEGNRESQAIFRCQACGHEDNADVNAAKTILKRAAARLEETTLWRGNTPSLDVEDKALAPDEASTRILTPQLDAAA